MPPIKISILDDHQYLITGLVTLLKPYKHIKIAGTFTRVDDLEKNLSEKLPDVLLMDLLMPEKQGKDLAPELLSRYPNLKILVLTSLDNPAMVSTMMRKGCKGYVLKDTEPEALVHAIETVHHGETFIEPAMKEELVQHVTQYKNNLSRKGEQVPELSVREKEILRLIAEEYTTKEISEKLFISYRTAESHRYNLIQKLEVKNTVGLIKVAIQLGLLDPEP